MIRIKVSYNTEDELAVLVSSLPPKVKSVKRQPAKGRYRRAYVDIDLQHDVFASLTPVFGHENSI